MQHVQQSHLQPNPKEETPAAEAPSSHGNAAGVGVKKIVRPHSAAPVPQSAKEEKQAPNSKNNNKNSDVHLHKQSSLSPQENSIDPSKTSEAEKMPVSESSSSPITSEPTVVSEPTFSPKEDKNNSTESNEQGRENVTQPTTQDGKNDGINTTGKLIHPDIPATVDEKNREGYCEYCQQHNNKHSRECKHGCSCSCPFDGTKQHSDGTSNEPHRCLCCCGC
ncbi:uncharacterized protein TM35_000172200 [Trypanosoma theileri]|uniref:Uncharacterized protein n=1 Tax=Trypanosoma theileri TaxID=67003 RepID=A0A1X0NUX4_9TRYP|nr:uncharacterized protein TM35_000172200 [Trypanosoma theileri]ORC88348.1 hypothetical protein TM35_000172200 [Trypanosoma theileri]